MRIKMSLYQLMKRFKARKNIILSLLKINPSYSRIAVNKGDKTTLYPALKVILDGFQTECITTKGIGLLLSLLG